MQSKKLSWYFGLTESKKLFFIDFNLLLIMHGHASKDCKYSTIPDITQDADHSTNLKPNKNVISTMPPEITLKGV